MAAEEAKAPGLEDSTVVEKYRSSAEIANAAMKMLREKAVEGASVRGLCTEGDDFIEKQALAVYTKKVNGKPVPRGVAFPVCISINNCVCHFSPLGSDDDVTLAKGDVVKIDLGAHIGGYAAMNATTLVVGADASKPVEGEVADCIMAAHTATELAARMITIGNDSLTVGKAIDAVAKDFGVTPLEDMQSFEITHNTISEGKCVIQNPSESILKDLKKHTFEENEVYALDVYMTNGAGKAKPGEARTTVYRYTGESYQLKMKASRAFFSEVRQRFTAFPFSLRSAADEKNARLGVKECVEHKLLEPYPVIYEREGKVVAQFRTLLFVTKHGTFRITQDGFDPAICKTDKKVSSEEHTKLLSQPLLSKRDKSKK